MLPVLPVRRAAHRIPGRKDRDLSGLLRYRGLRPAVYPATGDKVDFCAGSPYIVLLSVSYDHYLSLYGPGHVFQAADDDLYVGLLFARGRPGRMGPPKDKVFPIVA